MGFALLCVVVTLYLRGEEPSVPHTLVGLVGAGIMGVALGRMASEVFGFPLLSLLLVSVIFVPSMLWALLSQDTKVGSAIFGWLMCSMLGSVFGWIGRSLRLSFKLSLPSLRPRRRVSWGLGTTGFELPRISTKRARARVELDSYSKDIERWERLLRELKKR